MSTINAVIFDADGVVNDGKLLSLEAFGIPFEATQPFFMGPFRESILLGKSDLRDVLPPHLEEWGWKGTMDTFLDHWFTSGHIIHTKVTDAINALRAAGIHTYLATNQEAYRTQYMRTAMGYGELFDEIFASHALGFAKPDREFFQRMHAKLGEPNPATMLFWDDMEKNVMAARGLAITRSNS